LKFNTSLLQGEESLDNWFALVGRKATDEVSGEIHLVIQYGEKPDLAAKKLKSSQDSLTKSSSKPKRKSADKVEVLQKTEESKVNLEVKKELRYSLFQYIISILFSRTSTNWTDHDADLKSSSHVVIEASEEEEEEEENEDISGEEELQDSEEYEEDNWGIDDDDDEIRKPERTPTSLTASAILYAREEVISRVAEILGLPMHITQALLKYYSWVSNFKYSINSHILNFFY
jgi:hypothetical protein